MHTKNICFQLTPYPPNMSTNSSMNSSSEDGAGEKETFHIYILSFAYGLMMVGLYTLFASNPGSL